MDMGQTVKVARVSISPTSEIQLFGESGDLLHHVSATVERSYERPNKPKVLSQVQLTSCMKLVADTDRALLQFDRIFAIDSNSKVINGRTVTVAVIVLCMWSQRKPIPILEYAVTQAMEFRDVDCHPDLLALKRFFIDLPFNPKFSPTDRVGVVIDSHLGNLPAIQARQHPLLDDFFLPDWASLIYASDAANDRLPNTLLRESDKAATKLLNQLEGGAWLDDSQMPYSDHGNYFRVWNFK